MAFIDIHTNNLSRELRNSATFVDNWVYVPGVSITGDWKTVYAFTSLEDFKNTCGSKGPENSITFEFVSGLLSAGLPVLFRRIACENQDTDSEVNGVVQAEAYLHHTGDMDSQVNDVKILEKYGGTFGNTLSVTVRNTGSAYWFDIYSDYTLIERKKIITIPAEEDPTETNRRLIEALKSIEFERITVEVLQEDPEQFRLEPVNNEKLSGGKDFEGDVLKEIPKSYDFIADKILYQPKFLTSGGYCDKDLSSDSAIATAMLNLTLKRQDCRALIDLPLGTSPEDQQTLAEAVAYQQLSNNQLIPSGSICAPWQYMQIGSEQKWMPPSYVFLTVVGDELSKGEKVYTPKAGTATGQVQNVIRSEFEIGSDLSEQWQSDTAVNINPIMRQQGGKYVIAGNSTLLMPDSVNEELNAFSESSADLTIIEIKRYVYNICTELRYRYNSSAAFETFAINVSNFLNAMETEGAISDFSIYNISTNSDPRTLKIRLDVSLTPTIKDIEIYLNISYGSVELTTGGER